jgi:hypothetical protein
MYRRVGSLHYSFQSVKAVHLQGRRNYIQIHLQDQSNIYLCWHQTADPGENEASHFCIVSVSVYTRGHRPIITFPENVPTYFPACRIFAPAIAYFTKELDRIPIFQFLLIAKSGIQRIGE